MREYSSLKKFKVLVGTPHNEVKNYCLDDFLRMVTNLTYKKYNVLFADNSESRKNMKRLMKSGVSAVHVKQKQRVNQKYIAESHEALRVAALNLKCDFLMHIESDVFPPANIIERLLSHQVQVAAGAYFIDQGHNSRLMLQEIEGSGDRYRGTVNAGHDMVNNVTGGHDILRIDGKLHKVYSAGLGCILIHHSVLEKIKFRHEEGTDLHPDSLFALDLNAMGIPIHLDTSIMCEHRNESWTTRLDALLVK